MKISLGCDEAAYQLKETIKQHLQKAGHEVIDNGVGEGEVELYPDVAVRTCKKVTDGTCDRGILVCGTGIGMAMTANKVPGIRAAVCHDPFSTERSVLSNDANVMCMGARVIAPQLALLFIRYLDETYIQKMDHPHQKQKESWNIRKNFVENRRVLL